MDETFTLTFTHAGSTKNRHKYVERDATGNVPDVGDALIGPIYIKKSTLSGTTPATIRGIFAVIRSEET